jgi:subtilisin family serine protease
MRIINYLSVLVVFALLSTFSPTSYAQAQLRTEQPSELSKMDAKVSMLMHYAQEQREKRNNSLPSRPSRLLDALITDTDASGELFVKVFVKTSDLGATLESIEGLQVEGQFGEIASIRVPALQLNRLASLESVSRIEAMYRRAPLNDNANDDTRVTALHAFRSPTVTSGYLGEGVIVGVIDTGIDFSHPDFSDDNGTRIRYIRETDEDGTYVWSANDINTNPTSVTQRDVSGHGTHVTGTAVGSNPDYPGVAPRSEIIAVKTDFSDGDILAGVQFVFNKADSLNMPAVANLSLGGHFGSHDGKTLADIAMSSLTGPGRVIVAAAGNEGQQLIHASHQTTGTTPETGTYTPVAVWDGFTVIAAYFDDPTDINFGFKVVFKGETFYSKSWGKGDTFEQSEIELTEEFSVLIETETSSNDGTHQIVLVAEYAIDEVDDIEEGDFELYMFSYGSGTFNAWIVNGDWFDFKEDAAARIFAGNTNSTVGHPATSKELIAVGSYVTRNSWTASNGSVNSIEAVVGNISGFSSRGPSRDGRILPHITAPGELIASAMSKDIPQNERDPSRILAGNMHILYEGTSMATPHTAGIIALMLEANPALTAREVRDILQQTARSDSFTGTTLPSNTWGAGKVDAYAAVMAAAALVTTTPPPSTIDVTFTVNTSTIPDTVRVGDLVQIRGSVNGQEGDHFGTTINWGSGSVALQNAGGDYWRTTLKMAPGDRLVYKLYTGKQGADGIVDHAGGGWEANNPDPISNDYILEVPANATGNIELPVIYFNRTAPYVSKADSIALFFRVNVGNQIATGALNPATDVVGVRGLDPILDWGSTKLILSPETMPEGSRNAMYSGALWVPKSMAGDVLRFKYVFGREDNINTGNITWDNGDDAFNPDGDGNNNAVVGRADTTYAFKFFEGRRPPMADIVSASVQFAVNVGVLEEFGFFNRNVGDKVSVPGGFNGWNTGSIMDYNEAFDAWTSAYSITEEVGARIAYKYFIDWDPSRTDPASPNYIPNLPGGWEEPGLTGGGDRVHVFTNETTQTTDDFGSGVAFFNSIPPQGIIRETFDGEKMMPVKFVVDMAPALDHSTPFDPAADNLYLIIQTPLFGLTQGLAVGDGLPIFDQPEQLERVKFSRVDGPGVMYELTLPVQLPTENHIGFVLAYVKPGETGERVVNGAGFAAGRRYYRYIQPLDASDRDDILWPSSAELNPITWKATNLDFEAPPEYGLEVSIDRESTMPGEYALYQNFPNPFNPTTNISFTLPVSENVQLNVYNVLGQRVATLVNGTMPAGSHTVNFNAANLASGVYIYSIRAGNFVQNRTMMLVK